MAVVSVKESHKQRRSGISDGKLTHTRVFIVITDDGRDGTAVALTAKVGTAKVPAYHEPHPKADGTWVDDLSAEPIGDSDKHFTVTAQYAEPEDGGFSELDPDPLKQPADISYGANEATEDYFYDRSPAPADWNPVVDGKWKGKPLTTSAGDGFEDSRQRETAELVINVVTNEETFNPLAANAFSHTINEQPLLIDGVTYPEHTLKLSPLTAEVVREKVNGVTKVYRKVTKVVKYRSEGWNDDIFDAGFNELDYPAGGTPPARTVACSVLPIMNGGGVRIDKPWPLNGKGKKKKNPTDAPAVLRFRPYSWKSWSDLKWS